MYVCVKLMSLSQKKKNNRKENLNCRKSFYFSLRFIFVLFLFVSLDENGDNIIYHRIYKMANVLY